MKKPSANISYAGLISGFPSAAAKCTTRTASGYTYTDFSTFRAEPHLRSMRLRKRLSQPAPLNWSSRRVTAVMERKPVQRSETYASVRGIACSNSDTGLRDRASSHAIAGRSRRLRGPW